MERSFSLPTSVSIFLLVIWSYTGVGQTTLLTEDFEGATHAFTLNTPDANSQTTGANTWVVNDVYQGGNGDVICLGLPFNYTIVNTAAQPSGISSPNGNYMHTASVEGIADGIECCSFAAADGLCIQPGDHFTRMTSPVNTSGLTNVELSFWWLCYGESNVYGEVYYSYDGMSWNLSPSGPALYNFQSGWVQQQLSDPAFDGQPDLYFGFRFVSAVSLGTPQDPGFAIDDVRITASGTANAITTTAVSPTLLCQGDAITVDHISTGTFGINNVFTVELSDASGSFAAPMVIGSLAGTGSGSIPCVIPPLTVPGSGYRVRVVSSVPAVTGSPASSYLTIVPPPNAGTDGVTVICSTDSLPDLFPFLGGSPDTTGTWAGPLGGPASNPAEYQYLVNSVGSCPADTASVLVTIIEASNPGSDGQALICTYHSATDLFGFLGNNPDVGGDWTDPTGAPSSGILDPSTVQVGVYTYTYTTQADHPCGDSSAVVVVTIDGCVGVEEFEANSQALTLISGAGTDLQLIKVTGEWSGALSTELFDMTGARVSTHDLAADAPFPIDLSGFSNGMYVLRVSCNDHAATLRLWK